MLNGLITTAYIISAILFILSLAGLSKQETAKNGNRFGVIGMIIALAATMINIDVQNIIYILIAMLIGSLIGVRLAVKVQMTEMPELVAVLHSFVGLAAVLVGYNSFINIYNGHLPETTVLLNIEMVEIYLGIFIGAITFTGSIVAYGKLHGLINSKALSLPFKNGLNLLALIATIVLMFLFVNANAGDALIYLAIMTAIALIFGWHLVASIGGADMPVVISMLNSYSGWAAAAAGFMLSNDLLIITGALVGSSGAILSFIMCKAMNRSFISVILGGFGNKVVDSGDAEEMGEYREMSPEDVADLLKQSSSVIITPGYGMAVAQAQYPVAEITRKLREKGSMFALPFIQWQDVCQVI